MNPTTVCTLYQESSKQIKLDELLQEKVSRFWFVFYEHLAAVTTYNEVLSVLQSTNLQSTKKSLIRKRVSLLRSVFRNCQERK